MEGATLSHQSERRGSRYRPWYRTIVLLRAMARRGEGKMLNAQAKADYRNAYESEGLSGVIDLACERHAAEDLHLWELAMAAKFGTVRFDPSRCDQDGSPSAETLRAFPRIALKMAEAESTLRSLIGL